LKELLTEIEQELPRVTNWTRSGSTWTGSSSNCRFVAVCVEDAVECACVRGNVVVRLPSPFRSKVLDAIATEGSAG
jgi:hypothetical protein